ncbi:autotransporter outer membrane beta-barrel domain-containing protein, partial [Snodgrassella communis]|uniref:autotransporter family protein n=1 Tax=Snodgrassella communis TaxID=2946699 RepID=UPI001EF43900
GAITLNNSGETTGAITNEGAGAITLNNSGTSTGNIINDSNSASSRIEVTNNAGKTLESTISNIKAGTIELTNNGKTTGTITNSGVGAITLNNSGETTGAITNEGAGAITLNNSGETTGAITNEGAGAITLNNSGTSTGNIINDSDSASSRIEVTNDAGKTLESTISNIKAGTVELTNNGKTTGTITNSGVGAITLNNSGETTGDITNSGAGAITLHNSGTSTSEIKNTGAGTITLDNSGKSTGNIINSSNVASSTIEVINGANTELESMISNENAGKITLTNRGTTTGIITNIGDDSSIHINNEALLKSKITNMGSGQVTLINSGIGDNTEIINSGDGEITVRNDKTLHNTNIINEIYGTGNISFTNNDKFEGNLINNTDLGVINATNTDTGIFIGTTGSTNNFGADGKINLNNQGSWINTGDSTLSQLTNTGIIKFSKIPLADINDENKYHTITVQGNYIGGGTIYVNTLWNDDSINKNGTGYTDRVNIEGDVTGDVTTVMTREGIYGDITQKEIPITHPKTVIHVDGEINGQGFIGNSPTTNAGEAQLRKIDQSLYGGTGTDYAWTLTAKIPTDPTKPIKPTPPKEVLIYAEPVSGYVQMPTVNMELGFTTIGTLYERRAENQTHNITGANNTALADNQQQTWGRILVKHLDKNGKQRLDTVGNQSVLQIGHDFILDENNKTGTRRHIGGYVSYGHNENDFRDQYRAKNGYVVDDHYTGKGRTDAVSVGGYGTFYGNNGGYIDLVGQVSYLRNKYNARSNESVHQNGWGAAVSAEVGKSFTVYGNNWFVEPQAQLAYQYLSLDNFNDGIRHIDQHNPSALRGRVGMRFGYNGATTDNLPPSSFYGIANIWHDFANPKSVDIGRDSLKEEYAKTWGEVGVGIQLPITRQSHFYGDVRYEKNFGSAKHKGFKGTLGYKYTWL